jgi:hypothetical protein
MIGEEIKMDNKTGAIIENEQLAGSSLIVSLVETLFQNILGKDAPNGTELTSLLNTFSEKIINSGILDVPNILKDTNQNLVEINEKINKLEEILKTQIIQEKVKDSVCQFVKTDGSICGKSVTVKETKGILFAVCEDSHWIPLEI